MSDIIEIQGVTKTFDHHVAVDDLALKVPERSIYGFIGPNGSGKTTTIRMIMNILYPDRGSIRIFGREQSGSQIARIGYLPEERGLYRKMRLRELIQFHAELKGVSNTGKEADYWLERFDLAPWAKKKLETLSKGMSQKVQFIVTIIDKPELVILDEPFSGLDPVNAELIREVILDLRKTGSTVIFSTHDMTVAEKMCDFIFMIYRGKKVLDGTLQSIQEQFGQDTLRVSVAEGAVDFSGIDGIDRVHDFGRLQEVRLKPGTDPQQVLAGLITRNRLTRFEMASPSLEDIFIRIAKPQRNDQNE
ncbi:MAG: ATP-binding cassette domain-containing protein [Bacteroidales bacterium]|jgi:ABC-2 type transport system ATP-binding protein|nr:ATP-binding cassette domain-containing protein [Bacteroidales bacterium]MDD2570971.1 ATP-binding cassette domain-containing protein [Bacteroidales bacterium]MDD4812413.1 ATP-binding cassette domain-containing protein [Bacteroidales bacterium]NLO68037.1 ATP-binding cassette domain-containing protein [Bacteroidales bacterium]